MVVSFGLENFKDDRNFRIKCFDMLVPIVGANTKKQAVRACCKGLLFQQGVATPVCIRQAFCDFLPIVSRADLKGNLNTHGRPAE